MNHPVPKTGFRIIEGTTDHVGKDKQLHLLKHGLTQNRRHVDLGNMKKKRKLKQKISEVLCVKQYRPSLNSQE